MQPPLAAETLSELIGSIYDCAVDPGLWPTTLTGPRQALDFKNAALSLMALPSGDTLLSVIDGVDPPWLDSMLGYSADVVEQWGGAEKLHALPLNEPAVLSWNDRANWAGNRYFVEWAVPQGIIDVMAIGLSRDTQTLGSHRHGPARVRRRDRRARGRCGPASDSTPLSAPWRSSRLLELRQRRRCRSPAIGASNALPTAIVLVDADRGIVDADDAGQLYRCSSPAIRIRSEAQATLLPTRPPWGAALGGGRSARPERRRESGDGQARLRGSRAPR